jgi:hypothetical protein
VTTTMDSNVEMVEKKRHAIGSFDDDFDDDEIVAADGLKNHEARASEPTPITRPAAETFSSSEISLLHPAVPCRNHHCFFMALLTILLGFAFVIGSFYIANEPDGYQGDGESLFGGEMGDNGQQQQQQQGAVPNINKVLQATGVLPSAKHQGKDWAKHHANKQHSSSSSSTGADSDNDCDHLNPPQDHSEQQQQQEVINWQQAKVSFDDGKKYEIVKQIEHDPGAFTYVLRKFISLLFHVFFFFFVQDKFQVANLFLSHTFSERV